MLKFGGAATAALVLFAHAAVARPAPEGFSELVAKWSPTVVNVAAVRPVQQTERDPKGPAGLQRSGIDDDARSLGSGFVVDASGLIVTNNHVVEGASQIFVTLRDGTRRVASVRGRDTKTDVALLKIATTRSLAAVTFGDSDAAQAGDWVIAIGNPYGLGGSVSAGIISARNRQLDSELYDDFIQTDAAINHGNSGGPLFDMDGRVVGLNSAIVSPSGGSIGIGFAIPANTVKAVVQQLRQYGTVKRGWIGANVQDLTPDLAAAFGLADSRGALVGHVTPGGPAAVAGLAPGDVVIRIDEKEVSDSRSMQRLVTEASAGRRLAFGVLRKAEAQLVQVSVGRRPEMRDAAVQRADAANAGLGFRAAALTSDLRARYRIAPGLDGVVVTAVVPGTPAAETGLDAGDVIAEVAQQRVRSVQEVKELASTAAAAGKGFVLLTLNRGGKISFEALRLPAPKALTKR